MRKSESARKSEIVGERKSESMLEREKERASKSECVRECM